MNYATINANLYNRVATSTAGATVRALAGGASSIFERAGLKNVNGRVFPWLVWQEIDVGGESGGMRPMFGSWWIYVSENGNAYQLLTISSALEALYGAPNRLSIAEGSVGVVHISRAIESKAPIALGMEVRLSYTRRG